MTIPKLKMKDNFKRNPKKSAINFWSIIFISVLFSFGIPNTFIFFGTIIENSSLSNSNIFLFYIIKNNEIGYYEIQYEGISFI